MTHSPIRILDGGLGTLLEDKYGVEFSRKTPLWGGHLLVGDQDTLLRAHQDFVQAGADVITTATYQVSINGFQGTKSPEWPTGVERGNIVPFLHDAVHLVERTRGDRPTEIALSLGPYGATMIPSTEYSGEYDAEHTTMEALAGWHKERFLLFTKIENLFGRVNYIAFETIPRRDEIVAIRSLLKDSNLNLSGKPEFPRVWLSCLFPGDDEKLPDGSSVEDVITAMLSNELGSVVPWGIGINCTKVWKMASLVDKYEAAVQSLIDTGAVRDWPSLVLYPDGTNGEVYNTSTGVWEVPEGTKLPKTPWEVRIGKVATEAANRGKWREILVGGCCKATPSDITNVRNFLKDASLADQN